MNDSKVFRGAIDACVNTNHNPVGVEGPEAGFPWCEAGDIAFLAGSRGT